jgi:environmental stress-induced protein Ves
VSRIALLRAADRHAQPWKNGGGVTREVAVFPDGADMATFDWRISIAEVAEAGPFSCFEGVDRVLTVLEGELALTFEGRRDPVRLTSASAPYRFAGDVLVSGALPGGPVRDLNVMVRRGLVDARVERVELVSGMLQRLDLPECCVLVALGSVVVHIGGADHHLTAEDALRVEGSGFADVIAQGGDHVLILIASI